VPTTDKTRGQVEAMKQYLTTAIAIDEAKPDFPAIMSPISRPPRPPPDQ
jgi:hypothetical protein